MARDSDEDAHSKDEYIPDVTDTNKDLIIPKIKTFKNVCIYNRSPVELRKDLINHKDAIEAFQVLK